jgi:hypothetical protein
MNFPFQFLFLSLVFILPFKFIYAGEDNREDQNSLICFSLSAAQNHLKKYSGTNDEIKFAGYISQIWALLLDDQNNLLVIGERDEKVPCVLIDDIVIALRTYKKTDSIDNPGVSIMPDSTKHDPKFQKVYYFGGIQNTNYGQICFSADLLLKQISFGFLQTGISGFPNEWDLSLLNIRAGRDLQPWMRSLGRSWFFPLLIRINYKNRCAVITSVQMQVRTDLEKEVELKEKYLELDPKNLVKLLKDNPEAVSVIFSRLFTEHYNQIGAKYPILIQLQNMLTLSALFKEINKDNKFNGFNYWMEEFNIKKTITPDSIPTYYRGENGIAYRNLFSGGVRGCSELSDAQTEYICSRDPIYLRNAVLNSRPNKEAISWEVPIQQKVNDYASLPDSTEKNKKQYLLFGEKNNKKAELQPLPNSYYKPQPTWGWNPSTKGNNLIAFSGRAEISMGQNEFIPARARFSVPNSTFSLSIPLNIQWVYRNRISFEAILPITYMLSTLDIPGSLPGFSDNLFAHTLGIQNPIILNKIQLLSGIFNGKLQLPEILIENSLYYPESHSFFHYLSVPDKYKGKFDVPFSSNLWFSSHTLQINVPNFSPCNWSNYFVFQKNWTLSSFRQRFAYLSDVYFNVNEEVGLFLGLNFKSSSIWMAKDSTKKSSNNNLTSIHEGIRLMFSVANATRSGINAYSLGYYFPGSDESLSGALVFNIDLSGIKLWDFRCWF